MFSRCGCGPSDCQNSAVDGLRSCGMLQPGLLEPTVQEAREEISLRPGGRGGEGGVVGGSAGRGLVGVRGLRGWPMEER